MHNKTSLSENDLDKLLNQSFLESHLDEPGNEKLVDAIAVEAFAPRSLIEKLTKKINLQILMISCFLLYAGIYLLFIQEPDPSHTRPNAVGSAFSHDAKNTQPSESQENPGKTNADKKTTSPATSFNENNISASEENRPVSPTDSIGSLAIQPLEPIHANDPEIILPKYNDSLSTHSITKEKKTAKTNKQVKRKGKPEWREHEVK